MDVIVPWMGHLKCVLVYFMSCMLSIHICMELYYQSYFVYYLTRRQQLTIVCSHYSLPSVQNVNNASSLPLLWLISSWLSTMLCEHCFPHLQSMVVYFILGRHCGGSFRSWVLALWYGKEDNEASKWFRLSLEPHSSRHHKL